MKISPHLTNYLTMICEQMQQPFGDDFRFKEALMHAFGLLASHMALLSFILPELESPSPFLRAMACWVYGQFGNFTFENDAHLRTVLDSLYKNIQHPDLPVRVNAAVSLI